MTASGMGVLAATPPSTRSLHIGQRTFPVVLPRRTDPRLHLAMVVSSLQVLGQTSLGFQLSIAQILLSLGTCAVIEVTITFALHRVLAWPASALLTGNGVALLLRVPGTEHGKWWSLHGGWIFVCCAAAALLSKYAVRVKGRPLFNPANLGLVACFLILGSTYADPQDLYWGSISPAIGAVVVVIVIGGFAITRRLGLLPLAASFYGTFLVATAAVSSTGHCMVARWHAGPVCGTSYWWTLVSSPEIFVFMLFMITDPRTTPSGRHAKMAYGVVIGLLAGLLIAPQTTEFATKVAILAALALTCALRPFLEMRLSGGTRPVRTGPTRRMRRPLIVAVGVVYLAVVVFLGTVGQGEITKTVGDVAFGGSGDRPEVEVDANVPITLYEAPDVAGSVDDATARQVALDVQQDLLIEARARRTLDADLAATALYGRRLDQVKDAIRNAKGGSPMMVTTFSAEHLTVVLVRGDSNPQAPPRIGVTLFGSEVQRSSSNEATPIRVASDARTFLVGRAEDGHFLVGDEIAAVGGRTGRRI